MPLRLLTARQREVLGLLALGCSNKEVATRLHVGASAVRRHIEALMRRYRVSRRAALVRVAIYALELTDQPNAEFGDRHGGEADNTSGNRPR